MSAGGVNNVVRLMLRRCTRSMTFIPHVLTAKSCVCPLVIMLACSKTKRCICLLGFIHTGPRGKNSICSCEGKSLRRVLPLFISFCLLPLFLCCLCCLHCSMTPSAVKIVAATVTVTEIVYRPLSCLCNFVVPVSVASVSLLPCLSRFPLFSCLLCCLLPLLS